MHELEAKKLIERRPGRGTLVLPPPEHVRDLYEHISGEDRKLRDIAELRETIEPHERRLATFIVSKVGGFFGEILAQRENYAAVRDLLITSMRGAALTYSFRPRDAQHDPHVAEWKTVARLLLGEARA